MKTRYSNIRFLVLLACLPLAACRQGGSGDARPRATIQNQRLASNNGYQVGQQPGQQQQQQQQKQQQQKQAVGGASVGDGSRPNYEIRTREEVSVESAQATQSKSTGEGSSGEGSSGEGSTETRSGITTVIVPPASSAKTSGSSLPSIGTPSISTSTQSSAKPSIAEIPTIKTPAVGKSEREGGIAADKPSIETPNSPQSLGWAAEREVARPGEQIITGGADRSHQLYTDAKADGLLAIAVQKMNEQQGEYAADSRALAETVKYVNMEFNPLRQDVELDIHFSNGQGGLYRTKWASNVPPNRITEMLRVELPRENNNYKFKVRLHCLDQNTKECTSSIISVTQVINNIDCKTIYIVYRQSQLTTARWAQEETGDVHVITSEADYQNGGKGETAGYRAFSRLLSNTVHATRLNLGLVRDEEDKEMRSPRFREISLRSWAVAYGASQFELFFRKHDDREAHNLVLYQFMGPLVSGKDGFATGELQLTQRNFGLPEVSDEFNENFIATIKSSRLLFNDGTGNLGMRLEFTDGQVVEPLEFNFSAYSVRSLLDLNYIRQIVK